MKKDILHLQTNKTAEVLAFQHFHTEETLKKKEQKILLLLHKQVT